MKQQRHRCRKKPTGKLQQCLKMLNPIVDVNVAIALGSNKTVAKETQCKRRNFAENVFRTLHQLGYKITDPKKLGNRLLVVLTQHWVDEDLAPSTFQNNMMNLRMLAKWIGKSGMVDLMDIRHIPPEKLRRTYKATRNKDWSEDDDFAETIQEIYNHDNFVGVQLMLMQAFGLRAQEAMKLRVNVADQGTYLNVFWGVKGGRKRTIEILSPTQRDVLEFAKKHIAPGSAHNSTIPREYKFHQWRNRFYYIIRCHGVTVKNLKVAHGLRHGFAQRMFRFKTGEEARIRTNKKLEQSEKVEIGKIQTSETLGHSRTSLLSVYGC